MPCNVSIVALWSISLKLKEKKKKRKKKGSWRRKKSSDLARRMEALYYHGVKRTKVCSLDFRREDSRNYLNGRIPERWFCFKFALSVLLPRKGKHSSWPALSSFCYLPAEMHGKLMCRDLTILRSSHRSGTLLCMNCLQRGRMSSQSSRSCVQEFWAVL